ncbi:MAG TPA: CinA family protein [Chromatiales bacterium]|nr:CinA family protein [Chromatiales bacterium]
MQADDAELDALVAQLAERLSARSWTVVTAESCTGGWIGKALTDRPGSSAWFEGGCISYSNAMKQRMLSVDPGLLDTHGAVSRPVAEAMAIGARALAEASLSVAVTGIAGPGGGTPDKPVGTVWLAWCDADGECRSRVEHFDGDREAIRRQTVAAALHGLLMLTGPAGPQPVDR